MRSNDCFITFFFEVGAFKMAAKEYEHSRTPALSQRVSHPLPLARTVLWTGQSVANDVC